MMVNSANSEDRRLVFVCICLLGVAVVVCHGPLRTGPINSNPEPVNGTASWAVSNPLCLRTVSDSLRCCQIILTFDLLTKQNSDYPFEMHFVVVT